MHACLGYVQRFDSELHNIFTFQYEISYPYICYNKSIMCTRNGMFNLYIQRLDHFTHVIQIMNSGKMQ